MRLHVATVAADVWGPEWAVLSSSLPYCGGLWRPGRTGGFREGKHSWTVCKRLTPSQPLSGPLPSLSPHGHTSPWLFIEGVPTIVALGLEPPALPSQLDPPP